MTSIHISSSEWKIPDGPGTEDDTDDVNAIKWKNYIMAVEMQEIIAPI